MAIQLLVGLGNPGPSYAHTRHNAGAWWLGRAAAVMNLEFINTQQYKSLMASEKVAGINRWLLLPLTYMNLSGQAVASVARFYKIALSDILVVHDELDLFPGQMKLKFGGGHAGHNGLRDIQKHFGRADNAPCFWRLRIGIGHPGTRSEVTNWVLQKPPQNQREAIMHAIDTSLVVLPDLLNGAMDTAIRHINSIKPNAQ